MIAPPSFQSLYLRMKFGDTQLASGTGFLVATYTGVALVTARHNLTGRHHQTNACLHCQGDTGRIDPESDIGVVWKWTVVEDLMMEADTRFARALRPVASQMFS
jgi:hypothetical protein